MGEQIEIRTSLDALPLARKVIFEQSSAAASVFRPVAGEPKLVLDFGCNDGSFLGSFCDALKRTAHKKTWRQYLKLIGIDRDLTASTATAAKYVNQIEFQSGDITNLPQFADGSGLIVVFGQLDLALDERSFEKAVAEAGRILKIGGWVLFYGFHPQYSEMTVRGEHVDLFPQQTYQSEANGLVTYYRGRDVVVSTFRRYGLHPINVADYSGNMGRLFRRIDFQRQ